MKDKTLTIHQLPFPEHLKEFFHDAQTLYGQLDDMGRPHGKWVGNEGKVNVPFIHGVIEGRVELRSKKDLLVIPHQHNVPHGTLFYSKIHTRKYKIGDIEREEEVPHLYKTLPFFDGKKEGTGYTYNFDEQIVKATPYKSNLQNGTEIDYYSYDKKTVKSRKNYHDDLPSGLEEHYQPDGKTPVLRRWNVIETDKAGKKLSRDLLTASGFEHHKIRLSSNNGAEYEQYDLDNNLVEVNKDSYKKPFLGSPISESLLMLDARVKKVPASVVSDFLSVRPLSLYKMNSNGFDRPA